MATLEQRVRNLFPSKTTGELSPIAMVALIFVERRGMWFTHGDVIDQINKKYADSTVLKAFKRLSRPMDALSGASFIDIESVEREGRGSPIKRGRLSRAATEKIFASVPSSKQKPMPHYFGLNGESRLVMAPLQIGDKYLSSEDIVRIRKRKSGERATRCLLKRMANDKPGAEKEAMLKMIHKLAEKEGMKFNDKTGQFTRDGRVVAPRGKLAEIHAKWRRLPDKESPYAKPSSNAEIIKAHQLGSFPNLQKKIMDRGLIELAADENSITSPICAYVIDSREDNARVKALEDRAFKGDKAAFDELIHVLSSDESRYARQYAARSLGSLNNTRAIEPLIKSMLHDEYYEVRSAAVESLGPFGYRTELALALKDGEPSVRQRAASTLGNLKDVRAIQPLAEVLQDLDVNVQCAAANALGKIGNSRAVDSLIPMLDCENAPTRCEAAIALGDIGDRRSIQALRKAYDDPNECVRDTAKEAVKKLELKEGRLG